MKRTVRFLPLTLALFAGSYVHAKELSNYNINADAAPQAAATIPAGTGTSAAGFISSFDEKRGVPTFFWAAPQKQPKGNLTLAGAGPDRLALHYAAQNAQTYGLSPAALKTVFVRDVHDTGRGGIIVHLGQRIDGVDVYNNEMKVLMNRQGDLIAIGGNLHAAATPKTKGKSRTFTIAPAEAIAKAFADKTEIQIKADNLLQQKQVKDGYNYFTLSATPEIQAQKLIFATPARAKKVFFPMPDKIVPAYYLEIDLGKSNETSADLWGYVISAATGDVLMRKHLTHDIAFNYTVWGETSAPYTPLDGPHAEFAPHPTGMPDNSFPAFIPPVMLSIEGLNTNPNGMPDPWLDAAATETNGNNVDAYADLAAPDGFQAATDLRADTTSANTFDRTYDTNVGPATSPDQIKASVTQLFYVNNWLHDYYYDSGFDESSGNAQALNFGRGGAEGDVLNAQAQDYTGQNNANMSTPADGQSPRMQMYTWNGPAGTAALDIQPINLQPQFQQAGFGADNFDITADLVLADDATNPNPADACQPLTNNVTGKIVLIDRGNCTFEFKTQTAQQAGAVGVLIANNVPAGLPGMANDVAIPPGAVTIGAFGISQADGNALKAALMNGAQTVTMSLVTEPDADGTIDNGIVAHEWGHYIHHRLTNSGSTQSAGESEGWGDFSALMLALDANEDYATGTFAAAIYSTRILGDAGYFGIRRFPYTRDMTKNGMTFKHVTNGVALPAGPTQPAAPDNWEVHNSGEVWATMVFQAYTELLMNGGHTFDVARRRMADYIVGGMKMAPVDPTFTEQRDGILAAAAAADTADFMLLATGFADRGAGTCAVSPDRYSADGSGVVEDYALSGQQKFVGLTFDDSIKTCDGDGILDGEEIGKIYVEVLNGGGISLTNTMVTVAANNANVSFPQGNTTSIASLGPYQSTVVSFNVALNNTFNQITQVDFTVDLDNAAACVTNTQDTTTVTVHMDDKPNTTTTETADSEKLPWTKWGAQGFETLADDVWSRSQDMNGNWWIWGQDYPSHSDTAFESPDLMVDMNQNFVISFEHTFDFEASPQNPGDPDTLWDGGLIEITSDNGMTWEDISMYTNPQYNGQIANVPGADNPLADRQGYTKQNPSYPNPDTITLDLGNQFAGKTVKFRYRIGSDAAYGTPDVAGWYIDNVSVMGITNVPFRTVSADAVGCNAPPMANAGVDLVVNEGDFVTLNASMSSDADNDPLTYAWSQSVGPNVVLSDAAAVMPTFTAPMVNADTMLTFDVTVNDGLAGAADSVNVLVKDVASSSSSSGAGGSGTGGAGGAGGSGTGGASSSSSSGSSSSGSTSSSSGGEGGMGTGGTGAGGDVEGSGGCGCEVPGKSQSSPTGSAFASLLAAAAMFFRRRRNRSIN